MRTARLVRVTFQQGRIFVILSRGSDGSVKSNSKQRVESMGIL